MPQAEARCGLRRERSEAETFCEREKNYSGSLLGFLEVVVATTRKLWTFSLRKAVQARSSVALLLQAESLL